MSKSKKKWQRECIKTVLSKRTNKSEFSDIILDNLDLVNSNGKHLPNSLYKFYTTTAENILDIKFKRLWLSHPSAFNDPYDCSIGYNEDEFEKKQILDEFRKNHLVGKSGNDIITEDEYRVIEESCVNGEEYYLYSKKKGYSDVIYNIQKEKSKELQEKISEYRNRANEVAKQKIENIRKTNIRIACFLAEKKHDIYYFNPTNNECLSKIQMWSHYANNHKGFCVEYDISEIKKDINLNYTINDFFSNIEKEKYLQERLMVITKGCLLPVIYTSQRVNIPYTKLKKYKFDKREEIIKLLYDAYITKSTIWSYENEWRLVVDNKIARYYDNKIPFPYIKKIYLGCKMEKPYLDELIYIADELGVEIEMMKMESNKFDMVESSMLSYKWNKKMKSFNLPYRK